MTCREFHRLVAPLTLWEVVRSQDERIPAHGRECSNCGSWLQQQQTLAAGMHSLREHSANRDAGPAVEQAVLRAFRQHVPLVAPVERESWFAPFALRLSRWMEVGAYAAAVTAAVVGVAAGIWYWQHSGQKPSLPEPAESAQVQPSPAAATAPTPANVAASQPVTSAAGRSPARTQRAAPSRKAIVTQPPAVSEQVVAQAEQNQGYIDLMLCDPLICAGDAQVVRMELPANSINPATGSSQPLMADVVVGDDGLVRAIRIVQ